MPQLILQAGPTVPCGPYNALHGLHDVWGPILLLLHLRAQYSTKHFLPFGTHPSHLSMQQCTVCHFQDILAKLGYPRTARSMSLQYPNCMQLIWCKARPRLCCVKCSSTVRTSFPEDSTGIKRQLLRDAPVQMGQILKRPIVGDKRTWALHIGRMQLVTCNRHSGCVNPWTLKRI
jgi:hypothetical protein